MPDPESAVRALNDWDGINEPEAWVRHIPSMRHRPGGDASQEYVAP